MAVSLSRSVNTHVTQLGLPFQCWCATSRGGRGGVSKESLGKVLKLVSPLWNKFRAARLRSPPAETELTCEHIRFYANFADLFGFCVNFAVVFWVPCPFSAESSGDLWPRRRVPPRFDARYPMVTFRPGRPHV